MRREITGWYSPNLNKNMEIAVYGHYGPAVLMFPSAAADFLEYERFYVLKGLEPYIRAGKFKVFSINSINREAWLNNHMPGHLKALRHQQYNRYIEDEVVPFIHDHCHGLVPILTTGVSLGALLSANAFFRRPDIFTGVLALSGSYDLKDYTKGFYNENVYFNSPTDYIANLRDGLSLQLLRQKKHIYIVTGQGDYERPERSKEFSALLTHKGIPHHLDLWGYDMPHDWPTWRSMFPYFLGQYINF
ncbi:MAG: esterase family protein [Bernardetiaceae bacterium]